MSLMTIIVICLIFGAITAAIGANNFNPNLLNVGQESVVCSHALRGGDWVWLAQSLSPAG